MNQIAIVVTSHGSAIVTVEHRSPEDYLVTGIESLPFDFSMTAAAVAELDELEPRDSRFVVDAEGLGSALWAALPTVPSPYYGLGSKPGPDPVRWRLHEAHGLARQALVDVLVVAINADALHFAAGLANQEPMSKALVGYRLEVKEDGEIGAALVVALCLALTKPPARRGGWAFSA